MGKTSLGDLAKRAKEQRAQREKSKAVEKPVKGKKKKKPIKKPIKRSPSRPINRR